MTNRRVHPLIPVVATMTLAVAGATFLMSSSDASPGMPGSGAWLAAEGGRPTPPATWVAAGNGLVVFGRGPDLNVARSSDPLTLVADLVLPLPVDGGVVLGDRAYLIGPDERVAVLDLTIPEAPSYLGTADWRIETGGATGRPLLASGDLLLSAGAEGLDVLDTSRLGHRVGAAHAGHHGPGMKPEGSGAAIPVPAGHLATREPVVAVAASAGRAWLALRGGSVIVADLSDPSEPAVTGRIPAWGRTVDMAVSGHRLLRLAEGGVLETIDLDDPSVRSIRHLDDPGSALIALGRTVIVAGGAAGLESFRLKGQAASFGVDVGDSFFGPSQIDVDAGDEIVWTWVGGLDHSTTSGTCVGGLCTPDGLWDSPVQNTGTFARTFAAEGGFPYFCRVHGSTMKGNVSVGSSGGSTPVVLSVKAKKGPLRLKVSGTGFSSDCTVFIDGQPAPESKCKDSTRALALKGKGLKAMLPKGVEVSVQVRNDDGGVSGEVPFTRATRGGGSTGGGGY